MLLPIDLVEVIMVATIAIVGVSMWRTVTALPWPTAMGARSALPCPARSPQTPC